MSPKKSTIKTVTTVEKGPFQIAAELIGLAAEVIEKLPPDWPEGKIAIGKALITAGVPTGEVQARTETILFWKEEAPTAALAPEDELEGEAPSEKEVKDFAGQMGIDPSTLMMFMMGSMGAGAGMEFDLSTMLPIGQIVSGYNPKLRNMPFMIMGQVERRLGIPIIIINDDGSVNPDLTVKYVMSVEEGFEPAPDNIFYDDDGKPYEVIKVGVDAQSIYDADPLDPSRALQKSGMGSGRVQWNSVSLEVRQVVYFASQRTGELNPNDDAKLSWLRANINPTTTRLNLRGEFPKALSLYNEAARTGALPTLRVQLSRTARRPEVMPRRRARTEGQPDEGVPFRPTF